MSEELKKLIQRVCQEVNANVLEVFEVFKEFFGEDRVDLQPYITPDLVENYRHHKWSSHITKNGILSSNYFNTLDDVKKDIIHSLLDNDALQCEILEDETVASYFLPILLSVIARTETSKILVYWPEVKVTNEYNDSVKVEDLYARILITIDGKISGTFGLNRTKYPVSHLMSDYMHSHIPGVNTNNLSQFLAPCLGSGPINNTIMSLVRENDLLFWQLFCRELDVYVTVESIAGVPYRRMKSINSRESLRDYRHSLSIQGHFISLCDSDSYLFKPFIKYLLSKNILKYNFNNGNFGIGMPYKECVLSISNAMIEFINTKTELCSESALSYFDEVIIENNKFKIPYNSRGTRTKNYYLGLTGSDCFVFKGKMLKFDVYNDTENNQNTNRVYILKHQYISAILCSIIVFLNINYGRSKEEIGINQESIIL
jgi:hypothetical protein